MSTRVSRPLTVGELSRLLERLPDAIGSAPAPGAGACEVVRSSDDEAPLALFVPARRPLDRGFVSWLFVKVTTG